MTFAMRRGVVAGLVASVLMGMVSMVGEALLGAGFWAAPTLIAATILRDLQALEPPVPLLPLPLVLGLMGHMMNSVVLAALFEVTVGRVFAVREQAAAAGAVFGLLVFAVMWLIVLPFADPVMTALNPAVFAAAHLVWGATVGYLGHAGAMVARRA